MLTKLAKFSLVGTALAAIAGCVPVPPPATGTLVQPAAVQPVAVQAPVAPRVVTPAPVAPSTTTITTAPPATQVAAPAPGAPAAPDLLLIQDILGDDEDGGWGG